MFGLNSLKCKIMDKYYLFAGEDYPMGGFGDYKGSFNSIEEAIKIGAKYSWYDVCKIENEKLIRVAKSEN